MSNQATLVTDSHGVIHYANPAFEHLTGYAPEEVLGQTPGILRSGAHPAAFYQRLWSTLRDGRAFRAVFTNRRKSGELYFEDKIIEPYAGPGRMITHYVATARDVTARVLALGGARDPSLVDGLTGLPRRALFRTILEKTVATATRQGLNFCLVRISLDHFPDAEGDLTARQAEALQFGASCVMRCMRQDADATARIGSRDFALILHDVFRREQLVPIINRLLISLQDLTSAEGLPAVSVSLGSALFPEHSLDEPGLLLFSEAACRQARSNGGNAHVFFDPRLGPAKRSPHAALATGSPGWTTLETLA